MNQPKVNETELLFEFNQAGQKDQYFRFVDPVKVLVADRIDQVIPCLEQVENGLKKGLYAAGYVSYEASPAFDSACRTCHKSDMPLLWFGLYEAPTLIDKAEISASGSYQISDWEPDTGREEYEACIKQIKREIYAGNTYQVNYTIRFHADFQGDDFAFYQKLSRAQSSQYSAYLNLGRYRILSASPELFFRTEGDKFIAKPMKGTAKRGRNLAEDQKQKEHLLISEKERAENVMIVDLIRNDLGKIAEFGQVRATDIFEVQKFPTVFQMISTIEAKMPADTSVVDVFRALFPCGSITGAPKISTMGIIADLEQSPRDVYCGAIGYITPQDGMCFNVPIRTVIVDRESNTAQYGAGGGITWDSKADAEYQEVLTKALVLNESVHPFQLLETVLLTKGEVAYLKRHLNRLRHSAEYFSYPYAEKDIRNRLEEYGKSYPNEARRVRLLLSEKGEVTIESVPYQPFEKDVKFPVILASSPIDNGNRFYYHKTTTREIYESFKNTEPNHFDVLLWNEKGEITEFTIGNIVVEIDGQKYTPPVSCGLLPGVLREDLLTKGEIKERVIPVADLSRATSLWLINSVRGWVSVVLDRN